MQRGGRGRGRSVSSGGSRGGGRTVRMDGNSITISGGGGHHNGYEGDYPVKRTASDEFTRESKMSRGGNDYSNDRRQQNSRGGGYRGGSNRRGSAFRSYSHRQHSASPAPSDGSSGGGGGGRRLFVVTNGAVSVGVQGWEGGSNEEALFDFLARHTENVFQIVEPPTYDGNTMILRVPNVQIAIRLAKLTNIRYAGNKLRFFPPENADQTPLPSNVSKAEVLSSIILSRYNAEQRILSLDGFMDDPMVRRVGLGDLTPQLGDIIAKTIVSVCPDVQSLSLSRMNLSTTTPFQNLSINLPNIVNLSLQDNNISSYRDLEPILGKNFTQMQELVLKGNPLESRECSKPGGDVRYRANVKQLFPSIQMLDFEPVLEEISFDLDVKDVKELPVPINQHFLENQDVSNAAYQFLNQYFKTFDSARPAIINLYDNAAFCSIQVNQHYPPWVRNASKRVDFGPFQQFNRNHASNYFKKLRDEEKGALLAVGKENIVNMLTQIPNITHTFNEQPQNYAIDAWMVRDFSNPGPEPGPPLMLINVVGDFYEQQERSKTTFSFTRSFLITPSPSSAVGVIVNDLWTIKQWSGNRHPWDEQSNQKGGMAIVSQQSGGIQSNPGNISQDQSILTPAIQNFRLQHQVSDVQHAQVVEFSKRTGLNYAFSYQCLGEHGWDFNRGLEGFEGVKNVVPPEAYAPM